MIKIDYQRLKEFGLTVVTDNWKGYPIHKAFPVFTGNCGSSWKTGVSASACAGVGIYMYPLDSALVYLHELGHAINGHKEAVNRQWIIHEYQADKYAFKKYKNWKGYTKKDVDDQINIIYVKLDEMCGYDDGSFEIYYPLYEKLIAENTHRTL